MRERLTFALSQLENEPDFSADESFQFDRSEEPWVESSAELDEIWRLRVKNDALGLALEDEPWEKIQEVLTKAPENDAPIGGLKVTTENGWFAARPSGTEDVYKIYAESFVGREHLALSQKEAKDLIGRVFEKSAPADEA